MYVGIIAVLFLFVIIILNPDYLLIQKELSNLIKDWSIKKNFSSNFFKINFGNILIFGFLIFSFIISIIWCMNWEINYRIIYNIITLNTKIIITSIIPQFYLFYVNNNNDFIKWSCFKSVKSFVEVGFNFKIIKGKHFLWFVDTFYIALVLYKYYILGLFLIGLILLVTIIGVIDIGLKKSITLKRQNISEQTFRYRSNIKYIQKREFHKIMPSSVKILIIKLKTRSAILYTQYNVIVNWLQIKYPWISPYSKNLYVSFYKFFIVYTVKFWTSFLLFIWSCILGIIPVILTLLIVFEIPFYFDIIRLWGFGGFCSMSCVFICIVVLIIFIINNVKSKKWITFFKKIPVIFKLCLFIWFFVISLFWIFVYYKYLQNVGTYILFENYKFNNVVYCCKDFYIKHLITLEETREIFKTKLDFIRIINIDCYNELLWLVYGRQDPVGANNFLQAFLNVIVEVHNKYPQAITTEKLFKYKKDLYLLDVVLFQFDNYKTFFSAFWTFCDPINQWWFFKNVESVVYFLDLGYTREEWINWLYNRDQLPILKVVTHKGPIDFHTFQSVLWYSYRDIGFPIDEVEAKWGRLGSKIYRTNVVHYHNLNITSEFFNKDGRFKVDWNNYNLEIISKPIDKNYINPWDFLCFCVKKVLRWLLGSN